MFDAVMKTLIRLRILLIGTLYNFPNQNLLSVNLLLLKIHRYTSF